MKIICDIRFYKSDIGNIDGNSHPSGFADKKLNVVINRIVMKLRENSFSLGEFDHLYINFTTCPVEGGIAISKRSVDKYHPKYRYYDVEISETLFNQLETHLFDDEVINLLEKVLVRNFVSEEFDEKLIHSCILEAVTQGENMLMKFNEKVTSKRRAVVYLRYLDSGCYFPLLRVFDMDENLIFETNLPEVRDLSFLGDIQLSTKKVTIKPRKNVFSKDAEAISFEL